MKSWNLLELQYYFFEQGNLLSAFCRSGMSRLYESKIKEELVLAGFWRNEQRQLIIAENNPWSKCSKDLAYREFNVGYNGVSPWVNV